jgi:hypothetical protein
VQFGPALPGRDKIGRRRPLVARDVALTAVAHRVVWQRSRRVGTRPTTRLAIGAAVPGLPVRHLDLLVLTTTSAGASAQLRRWPP